MLNYYFKKYHGMFKFSANAILKTVHITNK